ncbi:unnamed protein product [Enterobius vermicularis]|uniref:Uncharacterized protein n=1 Tax=Enterobius vermicularis TaxID=51028 RepID=A0A3P6HTC2_ENTVE|nr:unnamed protein product [Enterobius vermicularis]
MGAVNDEQEESGFQKRQKKLKAKIAAVEEENLAPRSWELSGEVTAMDRQTNSMLEKHVDYDHGRRIAPLITLDKTERLEAMIIQRIKDKAFDDVERKDRDQDTARSYRVPLQEKISKKSLAEVYEEQYQQKNNLRAKYICVVLMFWFTVLNSLSNVFGYLQVRPEITIVNNMASLRKEEVGPMASTEEMLVAPEEVKRHEKGEIKGSDERGSTDRARERRKKKVHLDDFQNHRILNRQKRRELAERKVKNGKRRSLKAVNVKSTNFFKELQETAMEEVNLVFI